MFSSEELRLFPMLADLTAQERETDAPHLTLPPYTTFLEQGSACGGLALVLSGTARVFKLAESGRELTLYRVGAGESCILTASCVLSDSPFPAFAVSETELKVLMLPSAAVRLYMNRYESWREYVFRLLAQRMATVLAVVEEVAFARLDHRLAHYLAAAPSTELAKTHHDIAVDLSSTREVVSRLLKDFEHRGWVELARGKVTVRQRAALEDFSAGRCVT